MLKRVASALGLVLARSDACLARYGGEEFAALMPDADRECAAMIAEGLRAAVIDLGIRHAHAPLPLMSISVGVASALPRAGQDPATLALAADQALYRAKREGRNRVALAP